LPSRWLLVSSLKTCGENFRPGRVAQVQDYLNPRTAPGPISKSQFFFRNQK
jgi:hypothetical protein